jgi:hypothetical protein
MVEIFNPASIDTLPRKQNILENAEFLADSSRIPNFAKVLLREMDSKGLARVEFGSICGWVRFAYLSAIKKRTPA